jgi:hypothetical protein
VLGTGTLRSSVNTVVDVVPGVVVAVYVDVVTRAAVDGDGVPARSLEHAPASDANATANASPNATAARRLTVRPRDRFMTAPVTSRQAVYSNSQ